MDLFVKIFVICLKMAKTKNNKNYLSGRTTLSCRDSFGGHFLIYNKAMGGKISLFPPGLEKFETFLGAQCFLSVSSKMLIYLVISMIRGYYSVLCRCNIMFVQLVETTKSPVGRPNFWSSFQKDNFHVWKIASTGFQKQQIAHFTLLLFSRYSD